MFTPDFLQKYEEGWEKEEEK
jgi:hypothetical protein